MSVFVVAGGSTLVVGSLFGGASSPGVNVSMHVCGQPFRRLWCGFARFFWLRVADRSYWGCSVHAVYPIGGLSRSFSSAVLA